MTYEEKYNQAIAVIKKIRDANKDNAALVDFIEYNYPELKEDEDEITRKEIISWMRGKVGTGDTFQKNKEKWIAWLEKQKKPIDKCAGCNNVKSCITCTDGDQYAHITEIK